MKRTFVEYLQLGAVAAAIASAVAPASADDGIPPMLFFTNPADGTEDVAPQTTVMFIFTEDMAATQSIQWSANVNAAQFNYTWLAPSALVATYLPGFPANSTITWTLNPVAGAASNFKSVDGIELPAGMFHGSFTVGAGGGSGDPNDPCDQGADGAGFGAIAKQVSYVQVGDAAPALDPEQPPVFSASFRASTNQVVTAVSLTGPGGNQTLTNLFGSYTTFKQFNTAAQLDAAFPSGNYTLNATGAGSATVAIGTAATVPVPKISNLSALASMDVTKDFTLNFAPFAGAGSSDFIFIQISGDSDAGEFHAPDPCVPRELPNTATSVVIPANTFKAGESYSGSIYFSHGSFDTNGIPGVSISANAGNVTQFEFTIGGGNEPRQPMWSGMTRNADGTITYTISGDAGLNLGIEAADTLDGNWTQLSTGLLAAGSFQFTVTPGAAGQRFYRARIL